MRPQTPGTATAEEVTSDQTEQRALCVYVYNFIPLRRAAARV